MKNLFLFLACILFLSVCKPKDKDNNNNNNSVTSTTVIPDKQIKLLAQTNSGIDLSPYKGKVVFINFWATWCKPCVSEMPSLQQLTNKLKDENIVFLFASDEAVGEIDDFKKSNNYTMEFAKVESLGDLNISAIPTTFIYDKNGALAFTETGARQWDSEESIAMVTKIIKQ